MLSRSSGEVWIIKIIITEDNKNVLVDEEDFEYLSQFKWSTKLKGGYAVCEMWENEKRKLKQMHRIVLKLTDSSIWADHINFDVLDNRKENLRAVTPSQNALHRKKT